jgi:Acyl-protein synthetase, LuxE
VNYSNEASELDAKIHTRIERWHKFGEEIPEDAFNELALRIFAHQLRYNQPYAKYCAAQGVTLERLPESWEAIPAVPSAAFKEAALATFPPTQAELTFATSGTTGSTSGYHYMENARLYDAALLAAFDRFMLPDHCRLRYLNLVPNPAQHPHSSLGYMMARVSEARGDGATAWYLDGDHINIDGLIGDLEAAVEHDRPVCIATTAFALVHILDALHERHRYFALPTGSRVMETGGFKGRSRVVNRDDLYARTAERFGMINCAIVAEYGMTELTSQYYDDVMLLGHDHTHEPTRYKLSPPWLRPRVVDVEGKTVPNGVVGALVHVDLADRSSCVAIQTEDLGVQFDEGLVLIGRESGAALRGCSLAAEELVVR